MGFFRLLWDPFKDPFEDPIRDSFKDRLDLGMFFDFTDVLSFYEDPVGTLLTFTGSFEDPSEDPFEDSSWIAFR